MVFKKLKRIKKLGILFVGFVVCCVFNGEAFSVAPAPQFQRSKVYSKHKADGSILTIFFAIVSGPSPIDIASFTVTGPPGSNPLGLAATFQQYGLSYATSMGGFANDGRYTLEVTDVIGRTSSVVREFTHDDSVPAPTGLFPADRSYVGTTTPTLNFSPASGDHIYQVVVWDFDSQAVWYISPYMTTPSFTVPRDMLQPDTAYKWIARVWDSLGQNCHESEALFYTGSKGTPQINKIGVLSFLSGDNIANFPFARGINVAPWDIDYFRATGPDDTVYDLNRRYYRFLEPAYNANMTIPNPPASIPDGTYAFEIKDDLGRMYSQNQTYTYAPTPDFIEDSRVPAENAYLNTDRPTFSWARVEGDTGDGSYLYNIRIVDYFRRSLWWFGSPRSTETTYTLPEGLNLPRGNSYQWQVNVIDAGGNNYRSSSYLTFTFNTTAAPSVLYVNNNDDTCNYNNPCYTSIQTAINNAATTASIRLAEGVYNEKFWLSKPKTITLQGGWNPDFIPPQIANKTFIKSPTVTEGSLKMQMLTVKP